MVKLLVNKSCILYLKSSKCLFNSSLVFLIIIHPLTHKNKFNSPFYNFTLISISPFLWVLLSKYYLTASKSLNVKLIWINFFNWLYDMVNSLSSNLESIKHNPNSSSLGNVISGTYYLMHYITSLKFLYSLIFFSAS